MEKYKVGDKVKVRSDLVVDECYGMDIFVNNMRWSLGKIVTISKVLYGGAKYKIEESMRYVWTDKMLESDFKEVSKNVTKPEFDIKAYKSVPRSVILARHTQDGKDYCFEIPQWIGSLHISVNDKIEVETNDGIVIMIASTPILSDVNITHFEKRYGATFPLKRVTGYGVRKNIKSIQISPDFEKNLPHPDKIKKCYEFYRKNHKLDRDIIIDKNNTLVDGYVAYLVAKMVWLELNVIKRFY